MVTYKSIENYFEKMANSASRLFGNSIVFSVALALVVFWFFVHDWIHTPLSDALHDIIIAITFLSFFLIQRTFTHFSLALHLKLNELVAAHDNARNHIIKAEEKTGEQIAELGKEHDRIIAEGDETELNHKVKPST